MDENTTRSTRENMPHEAGKTDVHVGPFTCEVPTGMTLDGIISLTDELVHLNELVMLHVEKSGGFTCPAAYFTIVTPVLDTLEMEIRYRYRAGMSKNQLKLIVQDWIDKEIAGFKGPGPIREDTRDREKHE
jgi:hypothetical protein